ncbi:hypothetical protein QFC19_004222 [Naganishia cerealis]|uniref:Uncharacterized protein n=1 Tax=Naganishia cerealis TaxID=610337 RepID=A0ACC2VXR2_9TREE|nr:hypothetical protein QFC19_004222 [Naganishia cerealis]
MDWADFSSPSGGFDRMPSALANSLAISQPLVREHLRHWPAEREELRRKLRKGHKELPSFDAYDYRFRVPDEGTENEGAMWIEEPFLDVWADLLMGGGWMDTDELTYRPANWVILEYQQRPATMSGTESTSAIFVFQEFVPLQYQDALQHPKSKRLDFFKRFPRHSSPADHTVKQTSSDGGKETVFDAQLRKGNYTKVVSLSKPTSSSSIGSPPPSTPQTPERHRQYRSFDTRVSPSDSSPTSRDTSVSFLNRLNKASPKRTSIQGGAQDNCTSSQVRTMVADSGDCTRYPTKGAVSTELHDSDRDMWIGVLAANSARAMTVQASPLVTKNASHLSSPGFCVVSRCDPMTSLDLPSLRTPTKPDITPYGSLVHYPSMLPAGTFRLVSGAGSPSPTLSFEISTKPSSDTLPEPGAAKREPTEIGPDHIRLARPARVSHQVLHHDGKSIHSMEAYVNNDSSRSTEFLEKDTERNNSTNTVISTRPFAQAAPVHLERPLPLPPTYGSLSGHRDTVFSVIDGYATNGCDTTSRVRGHDLGGGREASSGIFTATPLPTVKYDWDCPSAVKQSPNSRYSVYSNADPDAIYHSKDRRDSSGTPDSEEDHCDAVAVVTDLHDCESELDSGKLEPPNLAIIEAIARQPSPGRYGHGIPLAFVHEEPEIESDGSDGHYITATSMPQSMTGTRTGHFQ